MKHTSLFILLVCAISLQAQPLLVGHRGSAWGLENSSESFINGATKGYQYLETDVKVTKDGHFVCCHNDDLTTWGGSLTIASNTLAALQAETLSQTRSGVKYTGHLCSIAEYLDICKQYGVYPLIELKWATGINNNDCSNIPALLSLIESKGFRSTCIILTSMKPCLQYIRNNYPDITLQYLVYSLSDAAYDFCTTYGIDVDCRNDGVDKTTVRKFHAADIKVNVWTVNTNDAYKSFGNMGCDFITTDRLEPLDLPKLDVDNTLLPNEIDYPTTDAPIKGLYNPSLVSETALPDFLTETIIRKTLLKDGKLYILATQSDNTPLLSIINPKDGKEIQRMDLTGITEGTNPLSDMAFTADGILLGCNQATIATEDLHIYQWDNDKAKPKKLLTLDKSKLANDYQQAIVGGEMTLSGKLGSCYIWLNSYTALQSQPNVAYHLIGVQLRNSNIQNTCCVTVSDYISALQETHPNIMVSPMHRNNIIMDSEYMQPTEYTFRWEEGDIKEYSRFKADMLTDAAVGLNYLRIAGKVYAVAVNEMAQLAMLDITKGINAAKLVSQWLPDEGIQSESNAYKNAHIELNNGQLNLYLFVSDAGIYIYSCTLEEDSLPREDADFQLRKDWERSTVLGNEPEHIHGANAQQGGAANGCFYVNDCVDKKLYVFNSTGCLGSLPGGAGWGTALDDVGNIIIRNDKSTGIEHGFLIYPAGTTTEYTAAPLELSVTVPAAGQTNFISASGNILEGIGYVYMYPNQQNAVNIITFNKGEVINTELCDNLTMTGSTAGYVIPVNNNSENWIYQVRSTGFKLYNGGDNSDFFTTRSGTTPPMRNTTIGGDYFTLAGHKIFIHPSGANYQGGFTIRDITTNQVITSVDPIGTKGYGEEGNMSCANWLFAEVINQDSARIYLYCPSNGMAVYTLYDRNAPIADALTNITDKSLKLYPNPTTGNLHVALNDKPTIIETISITGTKYHPNTTYTGTELLLDTSLLPTGHYIIRIDGEVEKFTKQ
ncbi:MAG: hypothetical protein NC038_05850 [Paludibacter sp.]|nr:hypothetical protein [Bacteroidales bacterium]MCM1069273.1 hypothetical protein [Prevotella sp.]MCM1353744.1 hypothetical protein [Bacteroides sp.]MCM1442188.1 hypothetical protein [Muribaculum sp.]MCM1482150.1 hypothetical protein [Paludibacter sp.]